MSPLIEFFIKTYKDFLFEYTIISGLFFVILYVILKKRFSKNKIQKQFPKQDDFKREVIYSLISILIFSIITIGVFNSPLTKYNKIYWNINERSILYYIICFPIILLIHDTYYYWLHKFLHHPKVFKAVHLVHHKSKNPSPWAAYSMHPLEAFLEFAIVPILAFTIPTHFTTMGLYLTFELTVAVYAHCGYEFAPKGFNKHWFSKWINTSVHHNLHHNSVNINKEKVYSIGLYFTFWDRIMNTMDPSYDNVYEEIKTSSQETCA